MYQCMKIAESSVLQFGTKIIILNVTKAMTGYIQEPPITILVKFQLGHKGFPPDPGCIMIYSYHQMCPALNSKSY